jgi:hypothetical protein
MHDTLRHRQGARADIDRQQQFALRIDGRPHPVAGALKALDGCLFTDLAVFEVPYHGVELIELELAYMHVTEKIGGKGLELLCSFHQPLQHGSGINLKHPGGGADA